MLVTHFLDRIQTSQLRSLWHRFHNTAHSCEQLFFYYYFQCSQEAFSEFCSLDIFTCLLQKMLFHRCLFLCTDTVHSHFLLSLSDQFLLPLFWSSHCVHAHSQLVLLVQNLCLLFLGLSSLKAMTDEPV